MSRTTTRAAAESQTAPVALERQVIAGEEAFFAFQRGEFTAASRVKPILGGQTAITLTSAPTLTSLGVSVAGLGSATLKTVGGQAVATFGITGGSETAKGAAEIIHNGSGLELKDARGTVDARDFLIDTKNRVVDANVSVNGKSAGNVALFDIAADGKTLTLTATGASVVNATLGTNAVTTKTVIGVAAPAPAINPNTLGAATLQALFQPPAGAERAVIGGATEVTLTSTATLKSLGVSVSGLGTAKIDGSGANPVATFGITGGTVDPDRTAVLAHQGSGLELKDAAGTVDLRDFLVDTKNNSISANVTANGTSLGSVGVFDIGAGGALTLSAGAAGAVDAALGTKALTAGIAIGTGATQPFGATGYFA